MKLLTSIFSQLLEHTARVLLWNLLSCQKCLHAQRMAAMNAWIDMQQTSPLCYPAFAAWADRVFRKIGYFRDFRSSIFSVLQHIITYLCDCMCECIAFGTFAYLHTCVCTLSLHFPTPPCVTMCICGRSVECVLFSLCMFHTQHCLLETLSKSPQCDNWLPGVSVSLLLIIVIPCRKKKKKKRVW